MTSEGGKRTLELVLRWKETTMATRELQATVRERDGVAVMDLTGDIDASAEEALERAYDAAAATAPRSVVLNFARRGVHQQHGHRPDRPAAGPGPRDATWR